MAYSMDVWWSVFNEVAFPGRPKFTAEDVPDMTGKVVLITGGTAGIGKETARVLLTKNAKVWITARDRSKGDKVLKELKDATGRDAHFAVLNLANLRSVEAAAKDFHSKEKQLNVLFNNAGVMVPPKDMLTDEGYDLQFGTNVLGHFYFTKLLLPTLLATAQSSPDGHVRVVNVASNSHHWFGRIDYDTLRDGPARKERTQWQLYAQSKTGNIVFAAELARRYGSQGIVSTSLNPGAIDTDLPRHSDSATRWFSSHCLTGVSHGAITQLYLGTAPNGQSLNGKYFIPWARPGEPQPYTQDPENGRKLWEYLEEQIKDL